jgi:ABC-type multidrug transport system ATPase subunit
VRTEKLSGGMRQLLGIAFLMLADAPVLLLDEPGLSLDPGWRKWLQQKLRFEAERGKTILVTTHLIAEWNDVTDRCLLCHDGVIECELDPRNLPNDFDELEVLGVPNAISSQPFLGSARVSRADFGSLTEISSEAAPNKVRDGEAPSPAGEARALPRATRRLI